MYRLKNPKQKQNIIGGIIRCTTTDRYLLVLGREAMKWSFPKGHTNDNLEKQFDCLHREVYEETGFLDLPPPTRKIQLNYGTYFECEVKDEFEVNPIDINEIVEGKWVTKEEANKMTKNIDTTFFFRYLIKGSTVTQIKVQSTTTVSDKHSESADNEIIEPVSDSVGHTHN
jgi:8-oxo-dGTP pyrophosphatase MutT (NUDIX family)